VRLLRAILLLLAVLFSGGAFAINADERLADAAQERRARALSAGLRCLVCQNQSIDDSDATLAKDLRKLVRERISAGDNDAQVLDFVVARYGEFVLLRPRFGAGTAMLWILPFAALLAGAIFIVMRRRKVIAVPEPLNDAERRALDVALADADSKS
jgi:cytochrome c-type biogenesis protein CcmH